MNRATVISVLVTAVLAAGCAADPVSAPPPATSTTSTTPPPTTTTTPPPPDPAVAWLEQVCTELQGIPIGVAAPAQPGNTLEDLKREGVNLIDVVRTPLAALVTELNRIGPPPSPALSGAYADLRRPLDGLLNRFNTLAADIKATQPGEPLASLPDLATMATNAWDTARQAVHIDPSLRPIAAQTTNC
ncbi:hypothetical protein GCM10027436_24840 [Actinophytocola sediminis]